MIRASKNKQSNIHKKKHKLSYFKIILFILFVILIVFGAKYVIKMNGTSFIPEISNQEQEPIEIIEDTTIHISVIGDIMCHSPNYKAAYVASTDSYDFSPFFSQIATYTSMADITVGNLETTFAGKARGYSGYPTFNSPSELGNAIKDIGVDVVGTANNHCMDKGYSGIESTLDTLDSLGIDHMGTARSVEEQNTILVKDVNGIKIAFLAYTYGTNGITIPSDKTYCVNLIDKDLILKHINMAKELNVDLICINMHWGIEYQTTPNNEQKELADFLFENGVDIILGSHPHVLQKMEKRTITLEDGSTKDGFVIYSLGNFFSNQQDTGTRDTVILDIQVTKSGEDNKITIDSVKDIPVFNYNKGTGTSDRYRLIDLRTTISEYENGISNISTTLYNTFKSALDRIEKIITAV